MTESMRVVFHLVCSPDPLDKKSNIVLVFSIQKENEEETFVFPRDLPPLQIHAELAKNTTIAGAARSLKEHITITCNEELGKVYFDKEGNARFREDYLEDLAGYARKDW